MGLFEDVMFLLGFGCLGGGVGYLGGKDGG